MKIKTVLMENAIAPSYAIDGSAGADLYAAEKVVIPPRRTMMVNTGVILEIPEGYAGFVYARSGIATRFHVTPVNCVGVIDPSYRGEIKVALHNYSNRPYIVFKGNRVAQLVIAPYEQVEFVEADEVSATKRGIGGFGSTGN